jgi:hypothetical protein
LVLDTVFENRLIYISVLYHVLLTREGVL